MIYRNIYFFISNYQISILEKANLHGKNSHFFYMQYQNFSFSNAFFGLEPSRIIEIGSIGLNPTSVSLLGLS